MRTFDTEWNCHADYMQRYGETDADFYGGDSDVEPEEHEDTFEEVMEERKNEVYALVDRLSDVLEEIAQYDYPKLVHDKQLNKLFAVLFDKVDDVVDAKREMMHYTDK